LIAENDADVRCGSARTVILLLFEVLDRSYGFAGSVTSGLRAMVPPRRIQRVPDGKAFSKGLPVKKTRQ
jgi:hypothetical protein